MSQKKQNKTSNKSKKQVAKQKIKEIKRLGFDEQELRDLGNELMDKAILEITFQDLFDLIDRVVETTLAKYPERKCACEQRF